MKNKQASIIFWETANEYIHQYLPNIRKASIHTVSSYRTGINQFIDYLEQQKKCNRKQISYFDFNRDNIKSYLDWMLNEKRMATRTCNLRLTAIHSLIEFASAEDDQVLPVYLISRTIKGLKVESNPIEYFEKKQMRALLAAPNVSKKTERRNQMLLILMYDTGTRVQEVLDLQLSSLHLKSEIPYITIFGKGRKYRNVPIMRKTMDHLERYLREFHSEDCSLDEPLFYAIAYGQKHFLSPDTLEKMIKR